MSLPMWINQTSLTRRRVLSRCWNGIGALALADLLQASTNPLAPKKPHFPPKVKNVIFLFMSGGVSQVDTFEYKPELEKIAGKRLPPISGLSGELESFLKLPHAALPTSFEFREAGQSGRKLSTVFQHLNSV